MPVISLIAPRGRLDPALVSSLQGAFGTTGNAVWLAPDEAAEFPVAARPGNLDEVREEISDQPVDLNFIDDGERRKSLLIADMDMTMIGQECIDELAAEAGVGREVASITDRAMNGEIEFAEAVAERVGLMKGLPVRAIEHVLETRITLAPGGRTLVRTMKAHGARAALVSGGFAQFATRVGELLGFDDVHANALLVENGHLTGDVRRPVLGQDAKVEVLTRLSPDASRAIAIGDGANDLGMITCAGMGVAMHAKPVVANAAPLRIDHSDLTACLFLQGYSIEEFS
ncbi:MAG: phosphoserine phosphatase SerB [Boseongicola sp. SB0667_bin_21]|nr:phosphoserine phosphatase SerB [Boseongicola sp. SB0667_bin_21]